MIMWTTNALLLLLLLLSRRWRTQNPIQDPRDDSLPMLAEHMYSRTRVHIPQRRRKHGQVLDRLAARQQRVLGVLRELNLLLEELRRNNGRHAQAVPAQQEIVAHLELGRDVVPLRNLQHIAKHGARRPDEFLGGGARFADQDALEEDFVGLAAHAQGDARQQLEGAEGRRAVGPTAGLGAVDFADKGRETIDDAVIAGLDLAGFGGNFLWGVLTQGEVDDFFAAHTDVEVAADSYLFGLWCQ